MLNIYRNFFSQKECDLVLKEVYDNQSHWSKYENRATHADHYILGKYFLQYIEKYKDHDLAYTKYLEDFEYQGAEQNLFLEKIAGMVPNPQYCKSFARPGFHIIKSAGAKWWHYDIDKQFYPYHLEFPDYTHWETYFDFHYTFTLMLSKGTFTHDYYPNTYTDFREGPLPYEKFCKTHKHMLLYGDTCPDPDCQLRSYDTITSNPGDLILVEGGYLHRIGASVIDKEPRITLQMTGVRKNDKTYLFW
jgi:hypothetical protein